MSRPTADRGRRALVQLTSLALLLALWAAASMFLADRDVLPGPLSVFGAISAEAADGALFFHIGATLARVAAAFVLAMSIGSALGIVMGRFRGINRWLDIWLVVFLNLPALVTIVLCYLWIGLTEAAAVTAVALNKIPMVTSLMREGARALDKSLDDLGKVFRVPAPTFYRHIVLPQLFPYFAGAARTGTALIWKIVLVVEFLGRSNGVGFQIHLYFQLFDVEMVLAYALSFIIIMLVIEALVLQPIERRATRWRQT